MKLITMLIFAQLIAGVCAKFLVREKTYHACKNKLTAKVQEITKKNEEIAEKDKEIAEKNQKLAEKDREIAELSKQVADLVKLNMSDDDELEEILSNKPIEWDKPFDKHEPFVASKKEHSEMDGELEWDDAGMLSD